MRPGRPPGRPLDSRLSLARTPLVASPAFDGPITGTVIPRPDRQYSPYLVHPPKEEGADGAERNVRNMARWRLLSGGFRRPREMLLAANSRRRTECCDT